VIKANTEELAAEAEIILKQKLALGLFNQAPDRLEAMETLKIGHDISKYQFILILVDYNPYSKHFDREKLEALPFANQVKIFEGGFAMWEKSLKPVIEV